MLHGLTARAGMAVGAVVACLSSSGCTDGLIGAKTPGEGGGTRPTSSPNAPPAVPPGVSAEPGGSVGIPGTDQIYFRSAVRRLTRMELRQTLLDLSGVDVGAEVAKLPEDFAEAGDVFAFDNKYSLQQPSASLVEAMKNLADVLGARVMSDAALQARLVSCKPTGPGDSACLRTFVTGFGRRVLRRPLTKEEIDGYVTRFAPLAMEAGDFWKGVSLATRVLLQELEFLYRVEVGEAVPGATGVFRLNGFEVASRLSYFLWGTAPDDALLDAAGTGDRLGTPAAIRTAATRMLGDPRARAGIAKFHALWLGYERQPPPATLQAAMLAETNGLLEKVLIKDKGSWLDLFRSRETLVDATLAAHYGLPKPSAASGWVPYGTSGRQGLLSHGTFLGVERKHQDTSPTMRGHFVRTRLLCQHVPAPPADVDVDNTPKTGDCKADRYNMWTVSGCKACHQMMDPIGHALEPYDRLGKARTVAPDDVGKSQCTLTGNGEIFGFGDLTSGPGVGPFKGVGGLSDRLVASGALEACAVNQLASYYLGREVRDEEMDVVKRVAGRWKAGGHRWDDMLLDFVTLPGFGFRVAE